MILQIENIPIIRDVTFWHLIAGVFGKLLYDLISKHVKNQDATILELKKILQTLTVNDKVQDEKISHHAKEIDEIKKSFIN